MSKYPVSLRALLNDRGRLPRQAGLLVSSILKAYLMLEKEELIVRNIMPGSIHFTSDLKLAMFSDIRKISQADGDSELETLLAVPYSGQGFGHITKLDKADSNRDLFQVFLCILEVFVGTKLVLYIRCPETLSLLLTTIKPYITTATYDVLHYGLLQIKRASVADYVEHLEQSQVDLAEVEVIKLQKAAGDSVVYDQLLASAALHFRYNLKRFVHLFRVTPDLGLEVAVDVGAQSCSTTTTATLAKQDAAETMEKTG